ncbi:MAG: hypothetical protein MJ252_09885 [archaeon]|nr:hypothetical protein [archaeon]
MSNKSKTEDNNDQQKYKKDILQLFQLCELGNYEFLSTYFKNNQYPEIVIYDCIKKCLDRYEMYKNEYIRSIEILLSHINANFRPSIETSDGKTILMLLCERGYIDLVQTFFSKTKMVHILKEKDRSGKNLFHHLFTKGNKLEENVLAIFKLILKYHRETIKEQGDLSNSLEEADAEGKIPLNLILLNGWMKVLSLYMQTVKTIKSYVIPIDNNNLIHCAIEGSNFNCLKAILKCSIQDDFKHKNKDGFTPSVYAAKTQKNYFSKIIEKTEGNLLNNSEYNQLILGDCVSKQEIFNSFVNKGFDRSYDLISIFKLNQYIVKDVDNVPLEWNILITKKFMQGQKGQGDIEPEHILSKFLPPSGEGNNSNQSVSKKSNSKKISNSEKQSQKSTSIITDVSNFFKKYSELLNIKDHIDEESYPIDMIIYNKVILYYKQCDYKNLFETIRLYLLHLRPQNDTKVYKFIIYINFTLIIIEILIEKGLLELASFLINKTDEDLSENFKRVKNFIEPEYDDENYLAKYLNQSEVFSQFSPTWDDIVGYLNLLRAMHFQDDARNYLVEYKNVYKSCNYAKDLKIFEKLNTVYIMIKAKINYKTTCFVKVFKKVEKIKELYYEYSDENKLFYYNAIGILSLKIKNYSRAELMFKIGLEIAKKMNYVLRRKQKDALIPRSNFICYLQFNLALALFFQRKFKESNELLQELSKINIMKKNIYLWYRLGLTSLELHFTNRNYKKNPDIILKTTGYEKGKKYNNSEEEEEEEGQEENNSYEEDKIKENEGEENKININEEKEDSPPNKSKSILKGTEPNKAKISNVNNTFINNNNYDELYNLFEQECINSEEAKKVDNENIFTSSQNNTSSNSSNRLKQRIIVLPSSQEYNNTNSEYLKKAIYCFKKVILLKNSKNILSPSETNSMDAILNYVFKNNKLNINYFSEKQNEKPNKSENMINMLISTYLNLLFSLCLSKRYTEVLFLTKNFKINDIPFSTDIQMKISLYQMEALLALNRIKEAQEWISDYVNRYEEENFRLDMLNKINGTISNDYYFRLHLYLSNIMLKCKKKDYEEAENMLKRTYDNFFKGKEVPNYIFSLAIYIFCSQGQKGVNKTIKLIKKRSLDYHFKYQTNFNQNENYIMSP